MENKSNLDLADRFKAAFAYFNEKLFYNRLPAVVITIQRHRGACGFFLSNSFCQRKFNAEKELQPPEFSVHEIAIMPDAMYERSDREVLSTLVHEMCHLEQCEEGKPSRNGYHNKEWVELMKVAGLQPSSRGKYDVRNPELNEEQKRDAIKGVSTGQKISHYIVAGGKFDLACSELLKSGFTFDLHSKPIFHLKAEKSKFKFTCPSCGANAWAKSTSSIMCGFCKIKMNCEE